MANETNGPVNGKPRSNDLGDYPHVDLLYPSAYVKPADLRGKDVTCVIEAIEPRHELRRQTGKEYRPVITFRGAEKRWVLCKTNALAIAALLGPEIAGWIGKAITIYPTRVPFGRDTVDAIRVRPVLPK